VDPRRARRLPLPGDSGMEARGDFINGRFMGPVGEPLRSHNPAEEGRVVLETAAHLPHMTLACDAAAEAASEWAALSLADRWAVLCDFREALDARADTIADAIVQEIGKLR